MIRRGRKLMVAILTATMVTTTWMPVFAADNDGWTEASQTGAAANGAWEKWCEQWETIKDDWTQISITPGKNAKELNFAWYSLDGEASPKVKIGKNADMSDAKEFIGSQSLSVPGYKSNKATVTGLEENTTYYYSYGTEGNWSEPVAIKTQKTDSFGFVLIGDPQIGSSSKNNATGSDEAQGQDKATRNDTFNWNNTINKALQVMPNASFMLSAGDQIQSRNKKVSNQEEADKYIENEIEYAGYLSPEALRSLPVATSLGNHDAISGNYSFHFNNPNASTLGSTYGGGNYSFRYGNALFIMLNTNNRNIAEHKQFLEQAVNDNSDATWNIVTLHQDIYGSAEHSNEPEIAELRYGLVPIFEDNNIDIVLTGHDHAYSRSKILKGGQKNEETWMDDDTFEHYLEEEIEAGVPSEVEEYVKYLESVEDKEAVVTDLNIQSGKVVDPDGILYITAGSSTGSKYYENVYKQQAYIAERWQDNVPTFSTVNVDEVSLSISTYRTDNMSKIDETYTLVKSVDKTNLVDLIAEAELLVEGLYTSSTWEVFKGAIANAKVVAAQGDATSNIVAQAYADLSASMNSLFERGNDEDLEGTISEIENVLNNIVIGTEAGQYTEESVEELKVAIAKARTILTSTDSTQVQIDEALAELEEAIKTFKASVNAPTAGGDINNGGSNNNGNTNNGSNTNNGGNTNSGSNSGNNNTSGNGTTTTNPSTGDGFGILPIILAIGSLAGIGGVVYFDRKKKKQSA